MELKDIISILLHRFVIIVIVVLVFVSGGFLISSFVIIPEYKADATLIVNKQQASGSENTSDYTYNDLILAQSLVNTYTVIITSDSVLNQVIKNLNLDISLNVLRNELEVTGVNNTEIIRITVTDNIPQRAADIANEITRVCPDKIIHVVKAGSVEPIDYAAVPSLPSSPNIVINSLMAGFLGLLFIVLILIAIERFNKTIKTPDEIENLFGLPVLGQLPVYNKN